jgi:Spy/CpxP family protein refolding chaperone
MCAGIDKCGGNTGDQDELTRTPTNGPDRLNLLFRDVGITKWSLGLILMVILALAAVVFAIGPEHGPKGPLFEGPGYAGPPSCWFPGPEAFHWGMGGFSGGGHMQLHGGIGPLQHLNLSKEQLEKMKAMLDRSFLETRDLRYDLSLKSLEMRKVLADPRADEATLVAKQIELSSVRHQLMNKIDLTILEQRKILTPRQIEELDRVPMPGGPDHHRMGLAR